MGMDGIGWDRWDMVEWGQNGMDGVVGRQGSGQVG